MSEQFASTPQSREPLQTHVRPQRAPEVSPLDRLAALHDEAAETTRLANLLGRTPWLTALLAAGAMACFAYATGLALEAAPALWLVFMLGASLALLRLYRHAVRAPFELAALRSFHADLKAILLFAGFAWGAGLFFAGPQYNLLIVLAFSVAMTAAVELVARDAATARYFALPATLVAATAIAVGPLGLIPALLVAAAAGCVIGAAEVSARVWAPRPLPPLLTAS